MKWKRAASPCLLRPVNFATVATSKRVNEGSVVSQNAARVARTSVASFAEFRMNYRGVLTFRRASLGFSPNLLATVPLFKVRIYVRCWLTDRGPLPLLSEFRRNVTILGPCSFCAITKIQKKKRRECGEVASRV